MKKNNVKTTDNVEMEINLIPVLKELLRMLWLIVLVGLLVGAASFVGAKIFVKPTYRCAFTAYINNKQTQKNTDYLSVSDVNASTQIVRTYKTTLMSARILTTAAKAIDMDASYEALQDMVSTEVEDETQIITLYVVSTSPKTAYEFAKEIASTAPAQMANIVEGSSMKIIDYPQYTEKRYKPSYTRYALIGFIIGALLISAWVIVRYFLDDTVKNENDLESRFSLPILGVIPDVNRAGSIGSDYYNYYSYGHKKDHDEEHDEKQNSEEGEGLNDEKK